MAAASAAAASVQAGSTARFAARRFFTAQPPQAGHVSHRFEISLSHCGQAFWAPRFFTSATSAAKSGAGAPPNSAHFDASASTAFIDRFATMTMSLCRRRCFSPHPTHMKGVPSRWPKQPSQRA